VHSKLKVILGSSLCVGLNVTVAFAGGVAPHATSQTHSVKSQANVAVAVGPAEPSTVIKDSVTRAAQRLSTTSHLATAVKPRAQSHHTSTTTTRKTAPKAHAQYVTVQSGDTLWSIARRNAVNVSDLAAWNHISERSLLHPGQKLITYGAHVVTRSTSTSKAGSSTTVSARDDSSLTSSMASAAVGLQIAQYAERFIGVPYRWGGESPSGFDCSGLVQFTFGHFGIALGRTSYDQYNQGHYVSRSNLQPGDLVFFSTYGPGASHVGIYVGGGRFINGAGSSMRIDSLYNEYWASSYIGARRVVS